MRVVRIAVIALLVVGLLYVLGLFLQWEYAELAPTTELGGDTSWIAGLLNGMCAPFNLLMSAFSDDNKTVFQAGGDGWYALWWMVGAGVLFGSGSSAKRSKD